MKKLLTFVSLFLCVCTANIYADILQFRVTQTDYQFSTVYEMASDKALVGSVCSSVFHILPPTTHYDIYDNHGVYEGQGASRLFCLGVGTYNPWGTEIDVKDAKGKLIGYIDGQVMTTGPAKFSIYDAKSNCIAIAYLDENASAFTITDPQNSSKIIGRLLRNYVKDVIDNWDVSIYDTAVIPLPVIKVFAAFACDTQEKFKLDK